MRALVKKNSKNYAWEQGLTGNACRMCVGGIAQERLLFERQVSQSCRAAREKAGIDCGWAQDIGYELRDSQTQSSLSGTWR